MKVKASNGKEFFLVDVIAQILKYLKEEFLVNHLQRGGHLFQATDFDWVITVPAIWKAKGKQLMREAGYKVYNYGYMNISNLQWISTCPVNGYCSSSLNGACMWGTIQWSGHGVVRLIHSILCVILCDWRQEPITLEVTVQWYVVCWVKYTTCVCVCVCEGIE